MNDATNQTTTTEGTGTQATTEGASTQTTTTAQGSTTEGNTSLLNEGEGTKTETKTEGKAEGENKDGAKTGAPEKYEAFKAPEGYQYDDKSLEEVTPIFKDLGLNQDQAQKLMDLYAAKSLEGATKSAEANAKAYNDMRKGWQDQVKADPEIGKNLVEVKTTIGRALDSLGDAKLTADFKQAMDLTGAGDHPAFVKAFYKMAQAVTEGKHVGGKGPSEHGQNSKGLAEKPSAAQAIYGPNGPRSDLGSRAS